jgi:hypothetical protein
MGRRSDSSPVSDSKESLYTFQISKFVYRDDIAADLIISVFMERNEHDRQLLGSVEIHNATFHGMNGNEFGMIVICVYLR